MARLSRASLQTEMIGAGRGLVPSPWLATQKRQSKYPPAEPGALSGAPLKAAGRVADATR